MLFYLLNYLDCASRQRKWLHLRGIYTTGEFTALMYAAGIDPLKYLDEVPEGFLSYTTSIKNIEIPTNITSIGERAFYGCSGLTSITIPKSVISICSVAFGDCTNLTSVTISEGEGCTSIGGCDYFINNYAFNNCPSLKVVDYEGTRIQWGSIRNGQFWSRHSGIVKLRCSDGDIRIQSWF